MDEKQIQTQLDYAKESINALNKNQSFLINDIKELNKKNYELDKKLEKVISIITDPKVNEDLAKVSSKKLLKG